MFNLACMLCSICLNSSLLDHAVGGSVQQLAVNNQALKHQDRAGTWQPTGVHVNLTLQNLGADVSSVLCSWGAVCSSWR